MTIIAVLSTSSFMGVSLSEPVTFATDLMLALACYIFCVLTRKRIANPLSRRSWQWFFGMLGASTFLGGLGHLLLVNTGPDLLLSWLLGGLAIFFFEISAMSLIMSRRLRILFIACFCVKLIVFWIYILVYGNFAGVKIYGTLGLVFIVFAIHLINFLRSHALGSVYMMIGIVLTILSALIHSMRFAISERWFNHNDLSHVIVLASLFAIYQGAVKLKFHVEESTSKR
jgi:hypothetical protein